MEIGRGVRHAVQWGVPLEGDIDTYPLGELLAWLARSRATGVLTLARGMTIRRFHLRAGHICLVSSSEQELLLGQILVERKVLGESALAKALAGRGRSRTRLGRLLLRGGLVTQKQLRSILGEKVRRLLADALTWDGGRFLFEAVEPGQAGRRARRGEIGVAIALDAVLEQIDSNPATAQAARASDGCLVVEDGDVIESLAAERDDRAG